MSALALIVVVVCGIVVWAPSGHVMSHLYSKPSVVFIAVKLGVGNAAVKYEKNRLVVSWSDFASIVLDPRRNGTRASQWAAISIIGGGGHRCLLLNLDDDGFDDSWHAPMILESKFYKPVIRNTGAIAGVAGGLRRIAPPEGRAFNEDPGSFNVGERLLCSPRGAEQSNSLTYADTHENRSHQSEASSNKYKMAGEISQPTRIIFGLIGAFFLYGLGAFAYYKSFKIFEEGYRVAGSFLLMEGVLCCLLGFAYFISWI